MRTKTLFGFMAVALAATASCLAETAVLEPSSATGIVGETDGGIDARLLLLFDLDVIPGDAFIEYAGLALYDGADVPWDAPFVPVVIAAMTSDWDASNASWDGPSPGQSWEDLGGDWDQEYTTSRVLVTKAKTPTKFNLIHMVERWVSGEMPNYGIIAIIEEVADLQDVVPTFNAEALKPTLTIRYFIFSQDSP